MWGGAEPARCVPGRHVSCIALLGGEALNTRAFQRPTRPRGSPSADRGGQREGTCPVPVVTKSGLRGIGDFSNLQESTLSRHYRNLVWEMSALTRMQRFRGGRASALSPALLGA